jgi:hypothetical protein
LNLEFGLAALAKFGIIVAADKAAVPPMNDRLDNSEFFMIN